jgi:predicted GNAT family acetyltransferase
MRLLPGELEPYEKNVETVSVSLGNFDEYIDSIAALRHSITEFSVGLNVEALKEELEIGCKRVLIAVEDGMAVSMAMTTVERKNAAMIVSVCTHADYRGRGYAPAVMTGLCRELAAEGKTACLFYNNPVAGRIYASLGFRDIGRWCFATFN